VDINAQNENGETALHMAALRGDETVVMFLLQVPLWPMRLLSHVVYLLLQY
jgi:ankyrin repeat protein